MTNPKNPMAQVRRIDPVCGAVRRILLDAATEAGTREIIAEVAERMEKGRLNGIYTFDRFRLVPSTRMKARVALELGEGVSLKNDTLVARRSTLPADVITALPGLPLANVVETGYPDLDATPIRAVRQQGRTLTVQLVTERNAVAFDEILAGGNTR